VETRIRILPLVPSSLCPLLSPSHPCPVSRYIGERGQSTHPSATLPQFDPPRRLSPSLPLSPSLSLSPAQSRPRHAGILFLPSLSPSRRPMATCPWPRLRELDCEFLSPGQPPSAKFMGILGAESHAGFPTPGMSIIELSLPH